MARRGKEAVAEEKDALGKAAPAGEQAGIIQHPSVSTAIADPSVSQEWMKRLEVVRKFVCALADENEFAVFVHYCKVQRVDPLTKDAWFTVRWSKVKGNDGKDKLDAKGSPIYERRPVYGLSSQAVHARLEDRPDFAGLESGVVYDKDQFTADLGKGEIVHKILTLVKHQRGNPIAAWARLSRKGKPPIARILYLSERFDDRSFNWTKMTDTMIQKCAEMDVIRAAYAKQFRATYLPEEADMVGEAIDPAKMIEHVDLTERPALPPPTPPPDAAIDMEAPSSSQDATFITADQAEGVKGWMSEFKLSPEEFGKLIVSELGEKPKTLKAMTKPQYQKLAIAFGKIRAGEFTFDREKCVIVRPPETDAADAAL